MALQALLAEMLADSPGGAWMLDTTTDSSGNSNTLTAVASPPLVASIIPRVDTSARDFNGTTQYMTAVSAASLDLANTCTLEVWITADTVSGYKSIFSKGANAYQMFFTAAGQIGYGSGNLAEIAHSTVVLSLLGHPYHCVATKSGVTSFVYVNGVDVTGVVTDAVLVNTATNLHIGAHFAEAGEFFDGRIQAAAVYPTALSAARVLAHYQAGTTYFLPQMDATTFPKPNLRGATL